MVTLTKAKLESLGYVENPHMWLGSGRLFCSTCKRYTHHFAMSRPGTVECCEVCRECENYTSGNEGKK